MDYRSVRRQFWEYSKICTREILRGTSSSSEAAGFRAASCQLMAHSKWGPKGFKEAVLRLDSRLRGNDTLKRCPLRWTGASGESPLLPPLPSRERSVETEVQEETSCRGFGGVPIPNLPRERGIKGV